MNIVKKFRFLLPSILTSIFLLTSSAFAVTDYVFFSVNGDTTLTTMTQGDLLGWGSNCDVGTSVYWEIWYDVNNNSTVDPEIDVVFETFTMTDGIIIPDEIISDNSDVADGFVQSASFPLVFEPGKVLFRAVNTIDETSSVGVITVNAMSSPPNQINGQLIVPGHPAPDALLSNVWIMGELDAGLFIALTDINGNYQINIDNSGTGLEMFIEPGNIDGFVFYEDLSTTIGGVTNDIDFNYIAAVDSVYGYLKDDAGQLLPTINWVECSGQFFGGYKKDSQTKDGRYAIYFSATELGAWRIEVAFDNIIPDYLVPYQFNFSHDTVGSFQHDLIVTRTDTVLYVRITEDGGLPVNNYVIEAYSDFLEIWTNAVSGTGSDNITELHILSLDNTGWGAWIDFYDDRFQIPTRFLVEGFPNENLSPGDTVTINLTSNGIIVSDMLTVEPGDDPVGDWTQAWVSLFKEPNIDYSNNANSDGSFNVTCDAGVYSINAHLNGYLPLPSYRLANVTGDTTGNLGFEFNKAHATITGSLLNIPLPITEPNIGVYAYTGIGDQNSYNSWTEIDYQTGTYTINVCEGTWTVNPPDFPGWLSPAPAIVIVPDNPGIVFTQDFGYASLGCCVGNRGNADGDEEDVTDVDDLVYLVNFAFKGGPGISCLEEGDVSSSQIGVPDGVIDVDDLVFMVNFAFKGGTAPSACP